MVNGSMFYNGKTQAGSADLTGVALIYAIEAFEDTLLVIDRNADAVIFYSQHRDGL